MQVNPTYVLRIQPCSGMVIDMYQSQILVVISRRFPGSDLLCVLNRLSIHLELKLLITSGEPYKNRNKILNWPRNIILLS
jgi:hypothetical protein